MRAWLLADFQNGSPPNIGRCFDILRNTNERPVPFALGIRLNGTSVYDGVAESRPELGEGRSLVHGDIRSAIRLSRAETVVARRSISGRPDAAADS
jgi:hypothetical protein